MYISNNTFNYWKLLEDLRFNFKINSNDFIVFQY